MIWPNPHVLVVTDLSYLLVKLIYFLYFSFLALLCSLQDLSSLTRNRTQALGSENAES